MSKTTQLLILGALLTFTACSSRGEIPSSVNHQVPPQASDTVTATRVGDHVVIRNSTKRPVVFATLDRQFFQTVAASYCFGSASCGTDLAAADSASVKTTSINGVGPTSQNIVVFWWYTADVPPHQSGPPARVRQIVVPIG
jgi:hypothetical protein